MTELEKKQKELISHYEEYLNGLPLAAYPWMQASKEQSEKGTQLKTEIAALEAEERGADNKCYHECPACNNRCNCSDQPCSCCAESKPIHFPTDEEISNKSFDMVTPYGKQTVVHDRRKYFVMAAKWMRDEIKKQLIR